MKTQPSLLRHLLPLLLLSLISTTTYAQDEPSPTPPRLTVGGYVKTLQTFFFFNEAYPDLKQFRLVDTVLLDNLVHHRLNARWDAGGGWSFNAGLRNRLFYGDLVRASPLYAGQVDAGANDWLDLSAVWLDNRNFVGHSVLDRLFLEYAKDKWEIRLGRQRVNWGISTIWNPNDIFNAYAFTDFDYEERPGSDALRVRYFTGYAGSVELAVRGADQLRDMTAAARWLFHRGSYDLQLIGGYSRQDLVLGGGWAGNLNNAGFKGEATWFHTPGIGHNSLAVTANVDYAFPSSLYLNGGFLYNSNGGTREGVLNLFTFELSAKNLYPYRWATFVQASYPFTPLLSGGLAAIYSPVPAHPLFLNPTFTVSIADNWTLDAVGQLVFNRAEERYVSPLQAVFLRMKWSY